jgi:toxin HigB-1
LVHLSGVLLGMVRTVVLSRRAEKDLASVPRHIALKLQDWIEDVEDRGLEEVRKIRGYHDEP